MTEERKFLPLATELYQYDAKAYFSLSECQSCDVVVVTSSWVSPSASL